MNMGYQVDDIRVLDYEIWRFGKLHLRGPKPDLRGPYFSVIGSAHSFGRFTKSPCSKLLADACGVACLNLGVSGAGPSFFLSRPDIVKVVNRGAFAILQVMSGRSVENSFFKPAENQGLLTSKFEKWTSPRFAEEAYLELLSTLPAIQLDRLRIENRTALAAETIELLKLISVPKILLYWSTRAPDYRESLGSLDGYWGGFPHFVNSEVLDHVRPLADHFVKVVGRAGLPQSLYDRDTGEAVLMWPAERFPKVKHRCANVYYPSPEMHRQAAETLEPLCQELCRRFASMRASASLDRALALGTMAGSKSITSQEAGIEIGKEARPVVPPSFCCPYDRYDPETLAPLNKETVLRLAGLGWTTEDFAGNTVLDVGANTGLLSIQAVKLGAREVHATEVVDAAVNLIEEVAKKHSMPIRVSQSDFNSLRPAAHAADVVLFMEVIQWVMRNGELTVKEVIAKLIRLTRKSLYIEFPWDADDPHIREMTKLTHETFNAHLILSELTRYFRDVQFVRFMRYFGFSHSKGNRVLLRCKDLRPEAEFLSMLDDVDSLDMPLRGTGGMTHTYLLQGKTDLLVAKTIRRGQFVKVGTRSAGSRL